LTAADNHQRLVSSLRDNHHENIIIYSDGSKLSDSAAGAGSFISFNSSKSESYSWNLNSSAEIFDLELFAISKSLEKIDDKATESIQLTDIYIFVDSLSVIQRIAKNNRSSGQEFVHRIYSKADELFNQNIRLHIHWVPSHIGIYGNEMADLAAKEGASATAYNLTIDKMPISLISLRRSQKEIQLQSWLDYWQKSKKKGKTYQNLNTSPTWESFNSTIKVSRIVWSSYMQLKIGHGYFLSYLYRLPDYDSNRCDCDDNLVQSPAHILLNCSNFESYRSIWRQKLKTFSLTLFDLLCTKEGVKLICDFLSKTEIARWSWFR
jgi:ribonuclease HI